MMSTQPPATDPITRREYICTDMSGRSISPSLDTGRLAAELQTLGYEPVWLDRDLFIVEIDGKRVGFRSSDAPITNVLAIKVAKQKHIARELLGNAGLAVADGQVFSADQLDAASDYARRLDSPVVLKPTAGRKGRDVAVGVLPGPAFEQAFRRAGGLGSPVLVERQFTDADEARFLVARDRCIAVYGKKPPSVVGDGQCTIQELIAAKNDERRKNPHLRNRLIKLTEHRISWLAAQGYTPDDVPLDGTTVVLDLNANVSAGGDSFDRTDDVHVSYKTAAINAAAAVGGLAPAGVDILAHDFTRPTSSDNYIVCEVNSRAALGAHHHPAEGVSRDAAGAIVRISVQEVSGKDSHATADEIPLPAQGPDLPPTDGVALGEFYNRDAHLIALEFVRRGFDVRWMSPRVFFTKIEGRWLGFWRSNSHMTSMPSVAVADRKDLVRQLVAGNGLEVAEGRYFEKRRHMERSYAKATRFARSVGTVAVRPVERGGGSKGTTVGVTGSAELDQAWRLAVSATDQGVIVEKHWEGIAASFLVVGNKCVAVNRRTETTCDDITDVVHNSFTKIAIQATHALPDLHLVGVEVIAHDFRRPAEPGNYVITDVDSRPKISPFHFPTSGKSRDVARAIVDYHLALSRGSRYNRSRKLLARLRAAVPIEIQGGDRKGA